MYITPKNSTTTIYADLCLYFFFSFPPQAHEYHMAFIELPSDVSSVSVFTVSIILVLRSQEVLTNTSTMQEHESGGLDIRLRTPS